MFYFNEVFFIAAFALDVFVGDIFTFFITFTYRCVCVCGFFLSLAHSFAVTRLNDDISFVCVCVVRVNVMSGIAFYLFGIASN